MVDQQMLSKYFVNLQKRGNNGRLGDYNIELVNADYETLNTQAIE